MPAIIAYRDKSPDWGLSISGGPGTDNEVLDGYPWENTQKRGVSLVTRVTNNDVVSGNDLQFSIQTPSTEFNVSALIVIGRNVPNEVQFDSDSTIAEGWRSAAAPVGCPNVGIYLAGDGVASGYNEISMNFGQIFAPQYAEIARVYVGHVIQIPEGIDARWVNGVDDMGSVTDSAGLQAHADYRTKRRRVSAVLSVKDAVFMYGNLSGGVTGPCIQDLQLYAGRTGEVILIPRTGSFLEPNWPAILGICGRMDRVPAIRDQEGYYTADFEMIEER